MEEQRARGSQWVDGDGPVSAQVHPRREPGVKNGFLSPHLSS